VLACLSPLIYLCKGQLAKLPAILDIFYTSVSNTTSDYIGVEVAVVGNHGLPDGLI